MINCKATEKSAQARSFTLIELLVVLSIIAILMGLLIPALNMVKEEVNSNQCKVNMRDIGMLFYSFSNDKNGYWPLAEGRFNSTHMFNWRNELYVAGLVDHKNELSAVKINQWNGSSWGYQENEKAKYFCPTGAENGAFSTYAYPITNADNRGIGGDSFSHIPVRRSRASECSRPSEKVALLEQSGSGGSTVFQSNYLSYTFMVHNERSHYLFIDGHLSTEEYDFFGIDTDWTGGWRLFRERVMFGYTESN